MTQSEFDRLPGLLSLRQFMDVTGLTRRKAQEMRRDRLIGAWRANPTGYWKYYKRDAAKIGGFQLK